MNSSNKQELSLFFDDDNLNFESHQYGKIELHKISENFNILKIVGQNLDIKDTLDDYYPDSPLMVSLTNFPINVNDLRDLDGITIEIDNGEYRPGLLFTFMNIFEETKQIHKSKISFKLNNDGSYSIKWSGFLGWLTTNDKFTFSLTAFPEKGLVTSFCHDDDILLSSF